VRLRLYGLATLLITVNGSEVAAQGYGVGMRSCGEFARAYAANPAVAEDVYFTWAQGFMSGLNLDAVENRRPYRVINGNDMASQKIEIRSYCDAHPLATYSQSVFALYSSLPAMRANSN
jgi:hypothetical protein